MLKHLYLKSPKSVQNLAGMILQRIPRRMLFGRKFRDVQKVIDETEFLPREDLDEMQFLRLKEILSYSYNNVPYYSKLFRRHGIRLSNIKWLSDIENIPFLSKDIVRENFRELQSVSFKRWNRDYCTTGGTSGQPLRFYIDKQRSAIEWAFVTSIWRRAGYSLQDKRLVLRGEMVGSSTKRLWHFDPVLNQLSLSVFHMSDDVLTSYIELIQSHRPAFIHGYPSAIITLAQFIRRNHIRLGFKLKGIIGISENIIEAQRKYVESVFDARLFSHYGQSEKLILAGECEKSTCYHIEPLYGYAEILDANGKAVTKNGQVGELVGTGFINRAMPFIRYRTGDLAEYCDSKCVCGRNYTLLRKIRGRWLQEMLVTKRHSLISVTALNVHSDIFDHVRSFQFEQEEPGEVSLKIVPAINYTTDDTKKILRELDEKLDNQVRMRIVFVDDIEPTLAGKHIFLKQHLDISRIFPSATT